MLRGVGRYIRQHHVALLALFVALGGTALALDRNEVKSKHIAPGEVKLSDTNDKLRLKCPGGTRYHEGACIETESRAAANWASADLTCRNIGRRLPSDSELESFRFERGIDLGTGEWTSDGFQDDGGFFRYAVGEPGIGGPTAQSTLLPYRCVARPKR